MHWTTTIHMDIDPYLLRSNLSISTPFLGNNMPVVIYHLATSTSYLLLAVGHSPLFFAKVTLPWITRSRSCLAAFL